MIRRVLEFEPGEREGRKEFELEWLDRAIKEEWTDICKKLMKDKQGNERGLPVFGEKGKRMSCGEAKKAAGYFVGDHLDVKNEKDLKNIRGRKLDE